MNTYLAENLNQNEFSFSTNGKIKQAQYSADLVFHAPFDTKLNAKYSVGTPGVISSGTISSATSEYARLSSKRSGNLGSLNFDGMTTQATIASGRAELECEPNSDRSLPPYPPLVYHRRPAHILQETTSGPTEDTRELFGSLSYSAPFPDFEGLF
jgi:hypothetical protein